MIKKIRIILERYSLLSKPVKASLWYTICNILQKGMALLSTPVFTRLMDQSQYGRFTLFQSWYAIISIFATLNLFQAVYMRGLLKYENDEKNFTTSLLNLAIIITCIFGVIYLIFINFWTKVFAMSPTLMLFMFIQLLLMIPVEFWSARERYFFRYKQFVIITLSTIFISIILGIILVLGSNHKVEARVFADTFAKGIFGVILAYTLLNGSKFLGIKQYWKYALAFNVPLIPHFLSTLVLNQADRVMIGRMVGEAQAGIYSVAYTISMMMLLIVNAVNNSLVPYIYRKMKDGEIKDIRTDTRGLFILIAVLCVVTMIFAPEIVYVFAGQSYMEAKWIIPSVASSVYFIFCYSMFSTIEYYYSRTMIIAIISTICALVNIGLNLIFIPKFGYFAAGYVTLLSYILFYGLHYLLYRYLVKSNFSNNAKIYDTRLIFWISLALILIMNIMLTLYSHILLRYTFFMIIIFGAIHKRKDILKMIKINKQ